MAYTPIARISLPVLPHTSIPQPPVQQQGLLASDLVTAASANVRLPMSASFSSLSLPSLRALPRRMLALAPPHLPLRGYGRLSVFVARDPHSCVYRVYPSWIHPKLMDTP
jgi:hypothetical protein